MKSVKFEGISAKELMTPVTQSDSVEYYRKGAEIVCESIENRIYWILVSLKTHFNKSYKNRKASR